MHLRGGGPVREYEKLSFRIKLLARNHKGRFVSDSRSFLGMDPDSEWLLLANATDESCIRNHLSWQLWSRWDTSGLTHLSTRLVEVFVNDEYMGIYEALQRIDVESELRKLGHSDRDGCARIIKPINLSRRMAFDFSKQAEIWMEIRAMPIWYSENTARDMLHRFVLLDAVPGSPDYLTDEEFARLASESFDIPELMNYYLFLQVTSLPYDNVVNNVYVWCLWDGDGYRYRLSPWDMDMAFLKLYTDREDGINEWMAVTRRMLHLNVGHCREALWNLW